MPKHPFHEERPDHLPVSAEVWDQARHWSGGHDAMTRVLYQAIKKLETEIIALRGK
ncbi:hypothetical protein KXD96_15550 [Mycobacterium sp. SMC-2]|uniref:hypothetical protein n=1 Tax=Mycobacterium sp. SMC-2 TaxID=2857058 RepID=UPI0021B3C5E5|nr:hypothetical protein [Mycobacterium sp. SMC-2]UXA04440.1 hypothetical protein KXD96_15550 [Mycobacterium sp. SMC-2]